MSTNVSTRTITHVQSINFKLNMKDFNKILAQVHFQFKYKKKTFLRNDIYLWKYISLKLVEVSLSCLHFSFMFCEGEIKSSYFLQVW